MSGIETGEKGKKPLFGDPDLEALYRRTRQYAAESGMFRICRMEDHSAEGFKRVLICNLWRIDRLSDGRVFIFTRDLRADMWAESRDLSDWPTVPLWPVKFTRSLDWWEDLIRKSLWKALNAAGYAEIDGDDKHPLKKKIFLVRDAVMKRYLPRWKKMTREYDVQIKVQGWLDPKNGEAGARALRATFYEHIREKDLFGVAMALYPQRGTLENYLKLALHSRDVLRIARESRNLLPLMNAIHSDKWARMDLFSRKIWVRGDRKTTMADRSRFSARTSSFASSAGWRWLANAKISVVARWLDSEATSGSRRADPDIIEIFAHANINANVPTHVWKYLLQEQRYFLRTDHNLEQLGRIFRAFVLESKHIWKEQGFGALKTWLGRDELRTIADWFNAEGSAAGLPVKNAGWRSIERANREWHERRANQYALERGEDVAWESLVGEATFDGVKCYPLSSRHALLKEGYVQRHCVASYDRQCMEGTYRVFSLEDPDGNRSTLGIVFSSHDRAWKVDQHFGKCNGPISTVAEKAGMSLSFKYTEIFLLGKKSRRRKTRTV